VLRQITAEEQSMVDEIDILTAVEKARLLEEFNDTTVDYPADDTIVHLFEQQVQRVPQQTALIFDNQQFTYENLNEKSNQLAHYLQATYSIQPNDLVGIRLEQNAWMVISILASIKLGATYVPIDTTNPDDRIDYILKDSQCKFQIDAQVIEQFQESAAEYSTQNVLRTSENDRLAVIYTSGSTNHPKGVSIAQANLLNRLYWMWEQYPFEANEVGSMKTSIGFVDHLWELFGALLQGIPLVQFSKTAVLDIEGFIDQLEKHRVSRIVLVPSLLQEMLNRRTACETQLRRLKYWTCSGEVLPMPLVDEFYSVFNQHKLLNIYGSTEVTADATIFDTSTWYTKETAANAPKLYAYDLEESLTKALLNSGASDPFRRNNKIQYDAESYTDIALEKIQSMEAYKDFLQYEVAPNVVNVASAKFIGHMTAPMPQLINDLHNCVNVLNQNLVKYETSGVGTMIERQVLATFHHLIFAYPKAFYELYTLNADYAFGNITSGGTLSNITALSYALSKALGTDSMESSVNNIGLSKALQAKGYEGVVIIGSAYCHYSMQKALKLLGLGTDAFVAFDLDQDNLAASKQRLGQKI
ncbi:MAG: AMP-binding protein, partial [Bacteroidota bacterium]